MSFCLVLVKFTHGGLLVLNPFESINLGNEAYLKSQDEKLEKCKQKALDFKNELDSLDDNHKRLLADWVFKTAFSKEFIKQIQHLSSNSF